MTEITGKQRKINIGCGNKRVKDWTNIDIEKNTKADIVGDFRKMEFEDIEDIRMFFLLEHYSRAQGVEVLIQLHDWLKLGGILRVATPDMEYIAKDFKKNPYWITRHAFGSQESFWAYHLDAWWEEKYRQILPAIGFEILEVKRSTVRRYLPNIEIVAKKLEPNYRRERLLEYIEKHPHYEKNNYVSSNSEEHDAIYR